MDMLSQFRRRSMRETEPTSFLCEANSYLISSKLFKKSSSIIDQSPCGYDELGSICLPSSTPAP